MLVRTWAELDELLHSEIRPATAGLHHSHLAYRGVARAEWPVATSLRRLGGPFGDLERHLLRDFRRYAHGHLSAGADVWSVLTVAQHFGLPTRLLDWTYSSLVALHFATCEEAHGDAVGAVWMIDYAALNAAAPTRLREALLASGGNSFTPAVLATAAPSLESLEALASGSDFMVMFEPPSMDARVVNQFAALTVTSSANADIGRLLVADELPIARRVLLGPDLKAAVRERLDQSNITERILFPGLDGLARWLARYYSTRAGAARARRPATP